MPKNFEHIIDELKEEAAKYGLYLQDANVAHNITSDNQEEIHKSLHTENPDLKAMITSGEVDFAVAASFMIGDLAFDDRTQNPDVYDMDKQFKQMMPTEEEYHVDKLKEKLASGADIWDLFEEDEEENDE